MSSKPKEKSVTKDELVGMKVISAEGKLVGTVKDVGFTIGKAGISLTIENERGETQDIPWENIQGAEDFVVLKLESAIVEAASTLTHASTTQETSTQQATSSGQPTCKTCGGALTYIPQYQRWYCYSCKKYA
ncbi:MAG: PRC-barrel domain-containing protein [Candidatus Bathyarchaeota archaeon]|nr:PRC-barrel domain-containing protein [Candidatus Bathyarchaeota archaeon]